MPRSEERQGEGSRGDEVDVGRNRDEVLHRHRHELGVPAVGAQAEHVVLDALIVVPGQARRARAASEAGLKHDTPAGRQLGAAGVDDLASDVAARDVRKREFDAIETAAFPEIQVIQGAGADAHDRSARRGRGVRGVLESEDVEAAMLVESDCFH